jgi:sulfur oxidation c-type cytochrome SoxX
VVKVAAGTASRRGLARGIPSGLLTALALLSLVLVATAVWAVVKEYRAEWRVWQRRFAALEAGNAVKGGESNGTAGIQQIWLRDLDRVDRCTSCHLRIASPEATGPSQPFRAHPGRWLETHRVDRYGCTVCHGGQGEATSFRGAAHRPLPFWPEPMASPELMEARCGACHREQRPPSADWLARGRALMVDRNCVACHEVPGHDVTEVRAPRLDGLAQKVSPAWLRGWLKNPRAYLPRSRMGDFRLSADDVEALAAFLFEAHGRIDLDRPDWSKADAEKGGELFRRSRCVTCHTVNGKGGSLGPDLTHVGAKVTRDWLYSWIRDPQRLQPATLMPRFRFTDAEVRDLAAYLSTELSEPAGLDPNAVPPDARRAKDGRAVFERRGCYSCHGLEGFPPLPRIAPKLTGVGDRVLEPAPLEARGIVATLPNWLFTKLRAPEQILPTARMPTFGFGEADASAITVALLSLRAREMPEARTTRDPVRPAYEPQGEFGALVRRYRCLSCHSIAGTGHRMTATGGPLSTVPLDRIGSQLRRDYIEAYVQSPIAVRVGLQERMPHLNIAPGEARVLAAYLSSVMVDDAVEAEVPTDAGTVARGKALFDRHGCVACHIVGDKGGYVGPELNGSGKRLKPGWIVAWLLQPERWKPGTLEPDHGLGRTDAQALAAYVLSLPARKARTAAR